MAGSSRVRRIFIVVDVQFDNPAAERWAELLKNFLNALPPGVRVGIKEGWADDFIGYALIAQYARGVCSTEDEASKLARSIYYAIIHHLSNKVIVACTTCNNQRGADNSRHCRCIMCGRWVNDVWEYRDDFLHGAARLQQWRISAHGLRLLDVDDLVAAMPLRPLAGAVEKFCDYLRTLPLRRDSQS